MQNKRHLPAYYFFALLVFFLQACATYVPQTDSPQAEMENAQRPLYTFYLAGGLGNLEDEGSASVLGLLRQELQNASEESSLIFTGDNVGSDPETTHTDEGRLRKHLDLVSGYRGNTFFIPGNNIWKNYKTDEVEDVEDFIKDLDNEKIKFFPENACPLEHRVINDKLDVIFIDSKWFITNWSRIVNVNKKCTDIVTRRRFVEELEGYINDGQGKNILIVMHHPVFSNGKYAGKNTLKSHLSPIPVIGTAMKGIGDLGAFDPDYLNAFRYRYLRIAVSALAQASDRITVVSGHEENLQYLSGGGLHQIISGSLGSHTATRLSAGHITAIGGSLPFQGVFSAGRRGFAKLTYYPDGSSKVCFVFEGMGMEESCFDVQKRIEQKQLQNFQPVTEDSKTSRILSESELDKRGFYEFLWGDRYRAYYGKEVTAPVVMLDTLYGGLRVVKEGGGHQSFSLRLEDRDGRQYAMRSLQKSALKFLKYMLPGIAYSQEDYKDTWADEVVSDFFTTAHPYMQLTVNTLAKSAGINHSDNELFFIPKQPVLGEYNDTFGNELYFVERRPSDEQRNYKGYRRTIDTVEGKVEDFESTTDMLEKIKSDESYRIDQRNFIRARIFDMLIGDWDRHQDQWRWIEYETKDGLKEFMPVPRDRDNAFPKFDGFALKLIKLFAPTARAWQSFDSEFGDLKWLNFYGNKLDRTLLNADGAEAWEEEAKIIQQNLTPVIIESAFEKLPLAVRDSTTARLKAALQSRLAVLPEKALEYGQYLNKTVVVRGTEKDDLFEIKRLANGQTSVIVKRILTDEANPVIYERVFDPSKTKEIWIYGLGDDDVFVVDGSYRSGIFIRCIGGYGEDVFEIRNKKALKVYDWKHEKTEFKNQSPRKQLSDLYKVNSFHWRYFKPNSNKVVPNIGFRVDDGVFLGLRDTYLKNGFNGNPFRQRHRIGANYYFGFQAIELDYEGIFGNIFPGWNFEISGYYTSDRYSKNFFLSGNETVNAEDTFGRDYYRARLRQFRMGAGIAFHTLRLKAIFESVRVNENPSRLFTPENLPAAVFGTQNYAGVELGLLYKNSNAGDFPTKGLLLSLLAGYKTNLEIAENNFGYFGLKIGADQKLISSGDLVLHSTAEWKSNIGGGSFFFYHAPSIGGDNGLRGFRDERFTGKSYFYQSTDLKYRIKQYITPVSPVTIGIYGGFDYGRVWLPGDDSKKWHTSQGLGFWISSLKALTFQIGYFNSSENNMVQVGLSASL